MGVVIVIIQLIKANLVVKCKLLHVSCTLAIWREVLLAAVDVLVTC